MHTREYNQQCYDLKYREEQLPTSCVVGIKLGVGCLYSSSNAEEFCNVLQNDLPRIKQAAKYIKAPTNTCP